MIRIDRQPLKKKEGYTLQVLIEEGESKVKKYLHSPYEPWEEAKRWAEQVFEKNIYAYAVYGIGAVYHIEALLDRIKEEGVKAKIFLTEPFEEVLSLIDRDPRWERLRQNQEILLADSFDEVLMRAALNRLTEKESRTMKALIYPPYKDLDLRSEKIFLQTVRNIKVKKILVRNTLRAFKDCFPENLIKNAKHLLLSATIEKLRDLFPDRTAVIVSAGPSLEKNVDLLREYQDRVLIITGGRSAQALLQRGIRPHFICSLDSHEANYQLYESMDLLSQTVPMISSWGNHHKIVEKYCGKKIFFDDSGLVYFAEGLFGRWVEGVQAGLTVASLQLGAAAVMGCRRIIFIGQDMAYTGDQRYGKDTRGDFEDEREHLHFHDVKGNVEETVKTTFELDSFRLYLEEQIRSLPDLQFVNATEGGAYMQGTKVMPLAQALQIYAGEKENFDRRIEEALQTSVSDERMKFFRENLRRMLEDAKALERYGREALILAMKISTDYYKNAGILKKLEIVDKKIESVKKSTELSNYFIQEELHQMDEKTADEMKDKEIIEETKLLYQSIKSAGAKMAALLEEELKNIAEFELSKGS